MITFRQLSKHFGRSQILGPLDVSIEKGERIALVGSNGAGKTTLIRCLLGEYVYQGSVLIDGKAPRAHRTEVLKQIGFVPQISPPLKIPVAQLIDFVASLCKSKAAQIIALIEQLGLDYHSIRHLPFVKLSGGQKQKVLISIALGRQANILIMDEPAANLDPQARQVFFEMLAQRLDDAIMLISSHRLDEVAALVNRVIEMDQGRIVLDDKVADTVDLSSLMQAKIQIRRKEPAFARAIGKWQFTSSDELNWQGTISGADRLQFLGVLSRYAALISRISLAEDKE